MSAHHRNLIEALRGCLREAGLSASIIRARSAPSPHATARYLEYVKLASRWREELMTEGVNVEGLV